MGIKSSTSNNWRSQKGVSRNITEGYLHIVELVLDTITTNKSETTQRSTAFTTNNEDNKHIQSYVLSPCNNTMTTFTMELAKDLFSILE